MPKNVNLELTPGPGSLYYDADDPDVLNTDFFFTIFCRWQGEWAEEIDVKARTQTEARRVARAAIERDYEPMQIGRVERRYHGILYF